MVLSNLFGIRTDSGWNDTHPGNGQVIQYLKKHAAQGKFLRGSNKMIKGGDVAQCKSFLNTRKKKRKEKIHTAVLGIHTPQWSYLLWDTVF